MRPPPRLRLLFYVAREIFLRRRRPPGLARRGPGGAGSARLSRGGGLEGLLSSFNTFLYLFVLTKNVCRLLDLGV
jgi:hypothetical protein